MTFTHDEIQRLPNVLSAPRFATYLNAKGGNKEHSLALYQWNLELSGAFIVPLQICEVSLRNSIVNGIEKAYGTNWAFEEPFRIALPNPSTGYKPQQNLVSLRRLGTTGKIIAELKFFFWQKMFTSRHDATIWNAHFRDIFPNTNASKTVQILRAEAFSEVEEIRLLRNRIAHHEPIFNRNLQEDYNRIKAVISWTDPVAASWIDKIENVTELIAQKP